MTSISPRVSHSLPVWVLVEKRRRRKDKTSVGFYGGVGRTGERGVGRAVQTERQLLSPISPRGLLTKNYSRNIVQNNNILDEHMGPAWAHTDFSQMARALRNDVTV